MNNLEKYLFLVCFTLLSSYSLSAQNKDTTAVNFADTTAIYYAKPIRVTAKKYVRIASVSEIAAKMPLLLHKTPISVGIVTRKIFNDQNAIVLSDALKNISSINVQSDLGTHDYFLIRGFESTSTGLILLDGANEPDVSMFRFFGYGFYNLYNIEQVEALKGPAAFLYGGNTLSGAVNMVRKQPVFESFAMSSSTYSKFKSYRGTIDVGVVNSNIAFRLNGLLQETNYHRKHSQNSSVAINPAITWKLDKLSSLTINFEYVTNDIKPDIGIPLYIPEEDWQLPDVPATTSYQTLFDALNNEIFRLRLDYRRDFGQLFTLRNKFYFTKLGGNCKLTLTHIPYKYFYTWIVDRHLYSFDETQQNFGNQLEVLFFLNTGNIKHNLLVGFEGVRFSNHSTKAISLLNTLFLFKPVETVTTFDQFTTLHKIKTNAKSFILAPYVVDYITFSERFQLFLGGRFDIIDFHTDRRNAPFDFLGSVLSSESIPFSRRYNKFSPMIGLVINDSENLQFYVNAGKSFGQGVRVIDKPEKSTQIEIGYKFKTKNGKVRTSAAIYNLKKENMSIPLQGPLQGGEYSPIGSQRSQGFELELTAQPLQNWFLFLTYSFTEAELIQYKALTVTKEIKTKLDDFSGNYPAFVPPQMLNFWTTKEFINGFGFGFGIHYTGDQYVSVDNDFEIDRYITYDALVFYKFHNWSLRLHARNLTNTEYLTRGLGAYSVIPVHSCAIYGSIDVSL